jgi:integrase
MDQLMKNRYRVFRRGWGTYYCEDLVTKKQESLHTRERSEAHRLVAAKNEHDKAPSFSLHLARVYWQAGDPAAATRTWQHVMDEIPKLKQGSTQVRWRSAVKDEAFNPLRSLVVLETRAEHFLKVLEAGSVSTNSFLQRIHRFTLDMGWLPWPVLPRKRWPAVRYKAKRAITRAEHERILANENNRDWRGYYELLWHLGGSQTDMAQLRAENIDWRNQTIAYTRGKTGSLAVIRFDDAVGELLRSRPAEGYLFPQIAGWKHSDRAKAFIRRCRLAKVSGVSLHCYRYAWAERAKACGYPERFAQQALGHNSKAVHHAYSKGAEVTVPSLDDWERRWKEDPRGQGRTKLVAVDFRAQASASTGAAAVVAGAREAEQVGGGGLAEVAS